ncbi:MAG: 23S rRNA (pseudouridine(1915)-N(3))-methyltransferase RlmH [Clostridia bacterium]|nr:23S rRNA (pseudouridine(1915)-N(3))-methyltransferase RlmH [Clostridia bacterium]
MKINLICVGKVKEEYFRAAVAEYAKRLSRFCDFKITEVSEENLKDPAAGDIERILKKEGENILPKLNGKIFALAIEGEKLSSEKFAQLLSKEKQAGTGEITFVIGGSYGLNRAVKERAKLISFSDMTFPHTLFRVMFTEQLYRAFCIAEGTAYHK